MIIFKNSLRSYSPKKERLPQPQNKAEHKPWPFPPGEALGRLCCLGRCLWGAGGRDRGAKPPGCCRLGRKRPEIPGRVLEMLTCYLHGETACQRARPHPAQAASPQRLFASPQPARVFFPPWSSLVRQAQPVCVSGLCLGDPFALIPHHRTPLLLEGCPGPEDAQPPLEIPTHKGHRVLSAWRGRHEPSFACR